MSLYHYRGVIVSVYDGDTVTVDLDLGLKVWARGQVLRLYGIDTPEIRGAERPAGVKVRDFVRGWLPTGAVVEVRTYKDKTGKFGRWLAEIWPEGWEESVNARLLRLGFAEEYLP